MITEAVAGMSEDKPSQISPEEELERQQLLDGGFGSWTRCSVCVGGGTWTREGRQGKPCRHSPARPCPCPLTPSPHSPLSLLPRRDFNAFVRATEKYGRKNVTQIATEIEGKSEADVRQYSEVFWKRYKELGDWEKVLKNIERGEQKLQRFTDNQVRCCP